MAVITPRTSTKTIQCSHSTSCPALLFPLTGGCSLVHEMEEAKVGQPRRSRILMSNLKCTFPASRAGIVVVAGFCVLLEGTHLERDKAEEIESVTC